MPNRILRDGILDSRRVAQLSERAELFYRKLHSLVDDYGRYEADAELLRAKLYSRRLNEVSPEDVTRFLDECTEGPQPLVVIYEAENKRLMQVVNFGQKTRTKKYPDPPTDIMRALDSTCRQMWADVGLARATRSRTTSPPNTTPKAAKQEKPGGLEPPQSAQASVFEMAQPKPDMEDVIPLTSEAVRERFPHADGIIIEKIALAVWSTCDGATDAEIAEAVQNTAISDQKSPGFWVRVAPEYVRNKRNGRLNRARSPKAKPDGRYEKSRTSAQILEAC